MSNFAQNLFPKLIITGFSFSEDIDRLSIYKGFAKEHNFRAFVTDIATVINYGLNDSDTICSINFPFMGLTNELVLSFISGFCEKNTPNLGGYLVSVNKFDVIKGKWDEIRSFLQDIEKLEIDKNKTIIIGIDVGWFNSSSEMCKFFSIIDSYERFLPAIACYNNFSSTAPGDLIEWAKTSQQSSLKPVFYFGPSPQQPEFLNDLIKCGFSYISIPPKLAIEIITKT